jgi:hypothetical protein
MVRAHDIVKIIIKVYMTLSRATIPTKFVPGALVSPLGEAVDAADRVDDASAGAPDPAR